MKLNITVFVFLFNLVSYCQSFSQTNRINFPVNGSILQRKTNGSNLVATLRFGGQVAKNGNYYFSIVKKTGESSTSDIGYNYKSLPLGSATPDGGYLFFVNKADGSDIVLATGWYKLTLYFETTLPVWFHNPRNGSSGGSVKLEASSIEFGVGDVYFIGGQSNAAGFGGSGMTGFGGYNWYKTTADDNVVSTTGSTSFSPLVRVYENRQHENNETDLDQSLTPLRGPGFTQPQKIAKNGIPYVSVDVENLGFTKNYFSIFKNGGVSNPDGERVPMYPNGYNSWCWAPLGYKFATNGTDLEANKYQGVPTIWFNSAASGTSMVDARVYNYFINDYNAWERNFYGVNSLATKLATVVRNYGSVLGAKAVLWCQGENDTYGLAVSNKLGDNPPYPGDDYILSKYQGVLSSLITYTRENATGLLSSNSLFNNLQWFISKTSAIPGIATGSNVTQYLTSITINSSAGLKSDEIRNRQTVNSTLKIYEGPDSDLLISSGQRATLGNIHFTGNSLKTLADKWYEKITAPNDNSSVEPTQALGLLNVSGGGSSYTLTVNNTIGATHFFWQKNNEAIMRIPNNCSSSPLGNETTSTSFTFTNVQPGDVLHCYAYKPLVTFPCPTNGSLTNTNGRFHAVSPYRVPGGENTRKRLSVLDHILNMPSNGSSVSTGLIVENVSWGISSKPSWLNIAYDDNNNSLTFSVGSTTSPRSGNVVLTDLESSLTETITINQSGSGSTGAVSLHTLTPTNSSSEWSGYASARFDHKSIDGNTMQVSGVQYFQGIGTHADSRMVFNLSGGGYTTFYGKVGRDDEADNDSDMGKVQFIIKADGGILWESGVHGNTTGAESFSVNVSGKSTLELLVNQYSDGIYFDHANWMDIYLSGGGGPCSNTTPAGVSASPTSHGSGGGNTTLTASCSSGGTVQWSTGHTGNSVTIFTGSTTTYTATCISDYCTPSMPVSVTVTVPSSGGCSALTNNLVMGYWTVTGHALVAKYFHGSWWLVQKINNSPEQFLVRGAEMLTRGDVTLTNGGYPGLVTCFAYAYSSYGGLQTPSSVTFPTPSGYSLAYESDGSPYYTASGTPPTGCTDAYLSSSWTYASGAGSTGNIPKIGQSFDGNNMTMGSVNYGTSYPGTGIGTHATSEIIYDLGGSHSYTHFKATVGKDNEAVCGEDRMIFKVYNNATGTLLGASPVVGTPSYGLPQTAEMSVPISGVRYLKLVVEDGGDNIYCDHANWARARLACSVSGRIAADSVKSFFSVYPNVSRGVFTVDVELATDEEVTISLVSSSGAVYEQESYKGAKGRNVLKFNAGKVMSGLYHVRVSTRERVESKTVVIEK